jgi:hypothetical protein
VVDAERDAIDSVSPGAVVDRLHERRSYPVAAMPVHDCHGNFWRLLVHEALAVLGLGEEAVPDEADPRSLRLGDEGRVPIATPPLVEDRDLRDPDQQELRWKPATRLPVERGIEHVAEEPRLVCPQIPDLHERERLAP